MTHLPMHVITNRLLYIYSPIFKDPGVHRDLLFDTADKKIQQIWFKLQITLYFGELLCRFF